MSQKAGEGLSVLVIDDEAFHAETVAAVLERVGYACTVATTGKAGAKQIEQGEFDLILTDLKMNDLDGLAILRKAREEQPDAEVILITGHADVKSAVAAIKEGAAEYLTKPIDKAELETIVAKAAEGLRLKRANRELRRQLDEKFGFEGVIGNSARMHEVIKVLQSIAPTSASVLILGETGTGKDLVAKAIHNNSPRKNKPFIPLNCTALNENLLDDELFGHEAGAFTGADRMRKGRFEAANGGTLFLDEIGDMPLTLQAKLLRVLENNEIVRLGSNDPIKVNVRVVSATHRNLEALVQDNKFRQDPGIAEPVRRAMAAYHWPGNVRELRNAIESMVVLDHDNILGMDDVEEDSPLKRQQGPGHGATGPNFLVGRPLSEVERYYIEQALEITGGKREEAARQLGIGERTLYRVIKDWDVRDKIKQALDAANGDVAAAAKALGMREAELTRKMKKSGMSEEAK
jgi:two-component system response regulator HydG